MQPNRFCLPHERRYGLGIPLSGASSFYNRGFNLDSVRSISKNYPYPSITDVFYLAYYPVFFLGILFLSRKSENKILLFNNWLDATIYLLF
jgi:hypothetical protein